MFGDLLQPTHLVFILVILLIFFGGKKLPGLGKGLGEGLRGFKDGMKGLTEEESAAAVAAEKQKDIDDKRKEAEEKAYQEAKLAGEAKAAAEARLAAEKAGASAHLVTPKPEEVAR